MNLPVHPTQVDTRFFIPNVPAQIPNFPQVTVPPNIGQNVVHVLGLVAMVVQQNAGANAPRTFFANLISRNGWQNPECQMVIATVFEVVDYAIQTARASLDRVVQDAVDQSVRMMVAYYTSQYQEGLAQYMTPALAADLNATLQQFQLLRQQIQQFYQNMNQNQYRTPQYGMQPPQQPNQYMQYGAPAPMPSFNPSPLSSMQRFDQPVQRNVTAPPLRQGMMGGMSDQMGMPLSGQFGTTINTPAPATQMEEIWDRTPPKLNIPPTASLSGGPGQEPRVVFARAEPPPPRTTGPVFREIPDPRAMQQPVQTPAPVMPERAKRMTDGHTVTDPSDPYKEIVFADGAVLRRAVSSGWKCDWTSKQPYHIAYDPVTHELFHLKTNDGVVHETVIERTKMMEQYVDHELNPQLREAEERRLADKRGKALVDLSRMINLTPVEEKPFALPSAPVTEETTFDDMQSSEMPIRTIDTVISATDVRSAEAAAMVQYPELARASKDNVVEFYCESVTPRLTTVDLHATIKDLVNASTYADINTKLKQARERYREDGPFWDEIEQRLTATVNRMLKVGFALDWTIDSFSEDAVALIDALRNSFGEDVAKAYIDRAMWVIDVSVNTSGKDAVERLAGDEGTVASDVHEQPMVAFTNRVSVTKVPHAFEDLRVVLNGTSAVTKDGMPKLYEVIDAIFARTEDWPVCFAARYIKTKDNVWIALDHALLLENAYLMTRHTF